MNETPQSPGSPETPITPPAQPPPSDSERGLPPELVDYPVQLDFERQEEYARLLPLVKWLLAIPHLVVLFFVGIAAFLAIVVSWFAVLITGRYPRGLFDFVVGTYRWGLRVGAYGYLLTDRYPPFTLADDPSYPVHFDVAYPEEGVARWRPLFAWLLAIPYLLVAGILVYLGYLLVFFAFFTILFAKKFPEGMFRIVEIAFRWQMRGNAYAYWMVTRYPPFVWA